MTFFRYFPLHLQHFSPLVEQCLFFLLPWWIIFSFLDRSFFFYSLSESVFLFFISLVILFLFFFFYSFVSSQHWKSFFLGGGGLTLFIIWNIQRWVLRRLNRFDSLPLSSPLPTISHPAETWCLLVIRITGTQEIMGKKIRQNRVLSRNRLILIVYLNPTPLSSPFLALLGICYS